MSKCLISNPHGCPITHTMNIIGNKWTPIIIYALGEKKLRFGEIAVRIAGISRKVLTEQLKMLELRGIINRQAYAEIPPRVEYSLTQKGREILPILDQLCHWSRDIMVEEERL
ncbi:MAG TPA: transcriptional regulator [Flammeovirgaceae bacterium]|nr:transcriptional regulator [Flammeovirgaceae bacterium]